MQVPWFKAAVIGVGAGFVSGLLGVGGGIIIVPALVLWLHMDQKLSAASSVATITVTAVAALVTFGAGDSVNWAAAAIVFIGSATGAVVGARYLDRIPDWILASVFSLVLAVGAVRMWF
jgi:uncharacterized membrane protein YfcA